MSLNAPTGARCLLTCVGIVGALANRSLNAPTGARCLLTTVRWDRDSQDPVLMHLQVRGAC